MAKLHQIINWIPGISLGGIGILLADAAIWPDIKTAIDPAEALVMDHYIAVAATISVTWGR